MLLDRCLAMENGKSTCAIHPQLIAASPKEASLIASSHGIGGCRRPAA
jgi:hypothetical protein